MRMTMGNRPTRMDDSSKVCSKKSLTGRLPETPSNRRYSVSWRASSLMPDCLGIVLKPRPPAQDLSDGVDASDPYSPVRALRSLKHERLQKRLSRLDKDARLRSGARGMRARKALVAFEKVVAESDAM